MEDNEMARRYEYREVAKAPEEYSEAYDRYRLESAILAGRNTISVCLTDKVGLISQRNMLIGTKDGKYYYQEGLRWETARIPAVQSELKELHQKFLNYRQERINQGNRPPDDKIENWPDDLRRRRLKQEALLDVMQEEAAWLDKALLKFTTNEEADRSGEVLKYGCRQSGQLRNGVLALLDGQRCSVNSDGLLIIDDPSSPYTGMAVHSYREVICPAFRAQQNAQAAERLKTMQEEARAQGKPIPTEAPSRAGRTVPRSSLPPWPEGIKRYETKVNQTGILHYNSQ
jgi:hypothetical protein